MDATQRGPYEAKAQVEKEEHQRAKAEYIANAGPEKFKLKLEDQFGNQIDLSGDNDLRVGKTVFAVKPIGVL